MRGEIQWDDTHRQSLYMRQHTYLSLPHHWHPLVHDLLLHRHYVPFHRPRTNFATMKALIGFT